MTLPKIYRKSRENAILSFNFSDIQNGTGILKLFGNGTVDPTSDHFLSEKAVRASLLSTAQNSTGSTTVEFDLPAFNLTRTAKGTATVETDINITSYSGSGNCTIGARLYKFDGSTETAITSLITSAEKQNVLLHPVFLQLPITEHIFKLGDVLRLKVTITNSDGGNINCSFTYDSDGSTPLILNMPFKVQI